LSVKAAAAAAAWTVAAAPAADHDKAAHPHPEEQPPSAKHLRFAQDVAEYGLVEHPTRHDQLAVLEAQMQDI